MLDLPEVSQGWREGQVWLGLHSLLVLLKRLWLGLLAATCSEALLEVPGANDLECITIVGQLLLVRNP
jgi:hypothetical protein